MARSLDSCDSSGRQGVGQSAPLPPSTRAPAIAVNTASASVSTTPLGLIAVHLFQALHRRLQRFEA
jgi:hypothetical protein